MSFYGVQGLGDYNDEWGDIFGAPEIGSQSNNESWPWADRLARILTAGGIAAREAIGAWTGNQAPHRAQQQYFQPLPGSTPNSNPNPIGIDKTLNDVLTFAQRNFTVLLIAGVGIALFKSGRK
jgi:hypothetical protein